MSAPTRTEAIRTLQDGHAGLLELLAPLSEDDLMRPRTIGGGDWSAKDLIGHLTLWEELALRSIREWRRGERPWVEQVFSEPHGVDRINADGIERKAGLSLMEVRMSSDETHRILIEEISGMDDAEWNGEAPYEARRRTRLVTLLGGVLGAHRQPFGHVRHGHLPDLEAYVRTVASGPGAP